MLIEKPGARSAGELDAVAEAARRTGALVRIGFNHRYHRAFRQAREIFESGALGEMMFIRGRYGHGGRPGYDREWRADPALSGGGELIDQGVHLIDLSRWFLGDFPSVRGRARTYFWDMPVEDNGFLLLETARGQVAFLHASWTEWKNLFSFEIAGRTGKLEINGLGGSYGIERLTCYHMLPEMGPPETTVWEYPDGRRLLGRRDRRLPGRHPPRTPTRPRRRRRAGDAAHRRDGLPRDARMIITRSPLRISLGGGGTDLPSYYREHGGFLIAAAIDKYVYITLHETFRRSDLIKYSQIEARADGRRDQAPDHPRSACAWSAVERAAPGDHQHGRHPGRHRPGLVRQLHDRAAAARCTRCKKDFVHPRRSWPSRPATSRSTC